MPFEIQELDMVLTQSSSVAKKTSEAQRIFFDIEGGLTYYSDIIQFAFLRTDWNFNILEHKSYYYRNRYPIADEEFNVHGLTEEFLWSVTDFYFQTEIQKLPLFENKPTMYITYSSFDLRKINEVVAQYNLPKVDFGIPVSSLMLVPETGSHFDAFILSGQKLVKSLSDNAKRRIKITMLELGIEPTIGAHDALYDTIAMYELCREMVHI